MNTPQIEPVPEITLIIPVYNECKIIADTIDTAVKYFDKNYPLNYEILLVDDGSGDNSANIISRHTSDTVRLIMSGKNYGKGHAIRLGVAESRGKYVMFTDSDLAYGLDVCKTGVDMLKASGADMVIGSRQLDKSSFGQYTLMRKMASNAFLLAMKLVGGLRQSDSQCGCKLYLGDSARKIFAHCSIDGWSFDYEALLTAQYYNMKIIEMPVKIINHGSSKIRLVSDGIKMLFEISKIKRETRKRFDQK